MKHFTFAAIISSLLLALCGGTALAGAGKSVGNFPVREPEEGTALYVVYQLLKAGVDTDEPQGYKAYQKLVLGKRKAKSEAEEGLRKKEWENLRSQAGAYLKHDLYGFKIYVEEMTPGPAYVKRNTKKVYVTLKNQIEPEDRKGLFIVERNKSGKWRLRSLNL